MPCVLWLYERPSKDTDYGLAIDNEEEKLFDAEQQQNDNEGSITPQLEAGQSYLFLSRLYIMI